MGLYKMLKAHFFSLASLTSEMNPPHSRVSFWGGLPASVIGY